MCVCVARLYYARVAKHRSNGDLCTGSFVQTARACLDPVKSDLLTVLQQAWKALPLVGGLMEGLISSETTH